MSRHSPSPSPSLPPLSKRRREPESAEGDETPATSSSKYPWSSVIAEALCAPPES